MELVLKRQIFSNKSTIGSLYVNGKFQCFVLEDVTRLPNVKIKGQTAIPYGKYTVTVNFSNRFKRLMPQILDVPMFEGIRIHKGNTDVDTEGCLLVGTSVGKDSISNSTLAYNALFDLLKEADSKEKITIEIVKAESIEV